MSTVREARPDDLPAIVGIYNHAVAHTEATFDAEPWRVEDRRAWLASFGAAQPMFVCEDDETVVGYAYYTAYRSRPGYATTKEATVYVAPTHHRRGVGTALYTRLLAYAKERGVHVMIAVLGGENAGSEALHRRFGFTYVGRLREVGRKFDRWVDTTYFAKTL